MTTHALTKVVNEFEGAPLSTIIYRGKPHWGAREVGAALGYSRGGKRLATRITGAWSEELAEGRDYVVVTGEDLAELKRLLELGTREVPSRSGDSSTKRVGKRAPNLLLLTESGLHLVLQKTTMPAGVRLRRFLANEVLPQLARTGKYDPEAPEALPAPQQPTKTPAELRLAWAREDRLRRQLEHRALRQLVTSLKAREDVPGELVATYEVKATEAALGRELPELLPAVLPGWQSPTQIAEALGVTPNRVGRVITALGLRGKAGLSREVVNKARGHAKTVPSWLYSPEAVAMIRDALQRQGRLFGEGTAAEA